MRLAVIDLGTNTFHLLILEKNGKKINLLERKSQFVQIGKGGISKDYLAQEAIDRAIEALQLFKEIINKYQPDQIVAYATSATRSAKNGDNLINTIKKTTGLSPQIIDGDREAELIYKGVLSIGLLKENNGLIMDIGGGSVEFIIGNTEKIKWKKSFEVGAQRLHDLFHIEDPITVASIQKMREYLSGQLHDLKSAILEFTPKYFVGASGTFNTLLDIHRQETKANSKANSFPCSSFLKMLQIITEKDKTARLTIPGMHPKRVDMIVVASHLLAIVLEMIEVNHITVSPAAMKEGIVYEELVEKNN